MKWNRRWKTTKMKWILFLDIQSLLCFNVSKVAFISCLKVSIQTIFSTLNARALQPPKNIIEISAGKLKNDDKKMAENFGWDLNVSIFLFLLFNLQCTLHTAYTRFTFENTLIFVCDVRFCVRCKSRIAMNFYDQHAIIRHQAHTIYNCHISTISTALPSAFSFWILFENTGSRMTVCGKKEGKWDNSTARIRNKINKLRHMNV